MSKHTLTQGFVVVMEFEVLEDEGVDLRGIYFLYSDLILNCNRDWITFFLYFFEGFVVFKPEFIGIEDNSYFFSLIVHSDCWVVFVPIGRNGDVAADDLAVFDYEECVGVAIDADADVIAFVQSLDGRDGVNLNCLFFDFAFVEEEISFVVTECVVGFAYGLFIGVIFGDYSNIDGVFGRGSHHLDLKIAEGKVVLEWSLGADELN